MLVMKNLSFDSIIDVCISNFNTQNNTHHTDQEELIMDCINKYIY
jgi:hypothetical protein